MEDLWYLIQELRRIIADDIPVFVEGKLLDGVADIQQECHLDDLATRFVVEDVDELLTGDLRELGAPDEPEGCLKHVWRVHHQEEVRQVNGLEWRSAHWGREDVLKLNLGIIEELAHFSVTANLSKVPCPEGGVCQECSQLFPSQATH